VTAFNLKLADAAFPTSLRGLRLPNRRKLAAEFVFGVSEAESCKNRADPSLPATAQGGGSITYTSVSAHVRSHASAGYGFLIPSSIIPADDATLIAIRKGGGGTTCVQIGNAAMWCGFRTFGATNIGANGEQSTAQGAQRSAPAGTDVYFESLVLSKRNAQRAINGYGKLYYYDAGGVQQVATSANLGTTARSAWAGKQLAVGSTVNTDTISTNNFDAYFFALYQRPLSAAEIDEAYQSLKVDYATRGVTLK
jgi:hypothetical protein